MEEHAKQIEMAPVERAVESANPPLGDDAPQGVAGG